MGARLIYQQGIEVARKGFGKGRDAGLAAYGGAREVVAKARALRMARSLDRPVGEIRETRNAIRYGFAFGKLCVRRQQPLDQGVLEKVIDAPTPDERIRLLDDTPYHSYIADAHSLADMMRGLDDAVDEAVSLLIGEELDPAFEEFFRLDSGYRAGDEHMFFAKRLKLAYRIGSPFVVQLVWFEIDCANVRLLMRNRFAGVDIEVLLAHTPALVERGAVQVKKLQQAYRMAESAHELAQAITALAPFSSLEPEVLEDVHTLDIGLRALQERFVRKGIAMPIGPEPLVSYVARVQSEVALLHVLMVGLENGVDKELLRKFLAAGQ